jgi:hypothetical protein
MMRKLAAAAITLGATAIAAVAVRFAERLVSHNHSVTNAGGRS